MLPLSSDVTWIAYMRWTRSFSGMLSEITVFRFKSTSCLKDALLPTVDLCFRQLGNKTMSLISLH